MDTTQAGFVRFVFKIYKLSMGPTAGAVALYGSQPCIGEWKKEEALMVSYIGMSEWQVETMLPKNTKLTYRLLLLHPRTRHVLQEEMFDRKLETGETPTFVELTFDSRTWRMRPMQSKLTGNPIALHLPTSVTETIGKPNLNTDYLMQDRRERCRCNTMSASLEHQEAARERLQAIALEHLEAASAGRQPNIHPTEMAAVQTHMDENDCLARQTMSSMRKMKCVSGVNTPADLLSTAAVLEMRNVERLSIGINTESSAMQKSYEEIGCNPEEGRSDMDDESTIRQLLPSPYRMAMLGLAIGACVFCKMK